MAEPITVLVVEDHQLMVEGLSALIAEVPELKVVGTAGSVKEAVDAARSLRPQVILMDFRLPDGDGAEATERIRNEHPEVAVLFLSAFIIDEALIRAIDAGARGYVSKAASAQEVTAAIIRVAKGDFLIPAATMSRLFAKQGDAGRTQPEGTPRRRAGRPDA